MLGVCHKCRGHSCKSSILMGKHKALPSLTTIYARKQTQGSHDESSSLPARSGSLKFRSYAPSLKNSLEAGSMPILILSVYPASCVAGQARSITSAIQDEDNSIQLIASAPCPVT